MQGQHVSWLPTQLQTLPPDYALGDGASIVATGWRILDPDEPEYEQVYQEAARAYRTDGWLMPYAEGEQQPDEDDTDTETTPTG